MSSVMNLLRDARILIVEDEALLALDLALTFAEFGALVSGPWYRLKAATEAVAVTEVHGAVLDIDLAGEAVFPLAEVLEARGVPIVFHTGRAQLDPRWRDGPGLATCTKPTTPEVVAETLAALMAVRGNPQA